MALTDYITLGGIAAFVSGTALSLYFARKYGRPDLSPIDSETHFYVKTTYFPHEYGWVIATPEVVSWALVYLLSGRELVVWAAKDKRFLFASHRTWRGPITHQFLSLCSDGNLVAVSDSQSSALFKLLGVNDFEVEEDVSLDELLRHHLQRISAVDLVQVERLDEVMTYNKSLNTDASDAGAP